jgi:transketolase
MTYRPEDPAWEGRDRFYLSIGHYAIALYAAMIEAGILPEDEIGTYGMDGSRMPMSGMAAYTPGMEITGGSLGQGLGIAVGAALGLKRKQNPAFIYNMLSDGELGEGSTWEAVMSAVQWKLDNLIAIVDFNDQQADGKTTAALAQMPEIGRWSAFGWFAQEVDGNDLDAVVAAFDAARSHDAAQPRVIICKTKMCKGVPFLEDREITHFVRVEPDEWTKALAILDEGKPA